MNYERYFPERELSMPVLMAVVKFYRLFGTAMLRGPRRDAFVAWPRHVAAWLLVELVGFSQPAAGRALGGRDHSTVVHSLRRVRAEVMRSTPRALEALRLRQSVSETLTRKEPSSCMPTT